MEEITPRIIKIGKSRVGLIGLDVAINRILQEEQAGSRVVNEELEVKEIYEAVAKQNYIPETAKEEYLTSLQRELRRHRDKSGHSDNEELSIRILGPGCVTCNRIYTSIIDILNTLDIAADIEQIKDLDEIWRFGVTVTPALIINGQPKSAGRHPAPAEIEEWIKEALG
jgi:small redox-active disulfide protein 2